MPRVLVADAQRLGFRLDPAAARLLVDRMGANPVRLRNELERLALWAGEGGEVSAADLDAMIADTSEAAVWSLSDALLERDAAGRAADRRAADRPGRERHRPDLRPRLAPAQRLRRRGPARGGGAAQAGRVVAEDAPLRGQAAGRAACATPTSPTCAGDRGARRPGAVVPRRAPTTATSWRSRWPCGERLGVRSLTTSRRRRCGRFGLLARAGVLVHRALLDGLVDLRDELALLAARSRSASPPSTALSRRRKWVFTVLVSSRFSVRSRSLRRIRFFCEAMLAMSRVPEQAPCRLRAAADYSD